VRQDANLRVANLRAKRVGNPLQDDILPHATFSSGTIIKVPETAEGVSR